MLPGIASGRDKVPVTLQVNCGYACVAIFEISRVPKGASRASLDQAKRCSKFRELFFQPCIVYNAKRVLQ